MSSLFRHFTFGFQQLSKLFHDFTTDSYQIQTYAKNPTTVFQATAQFISACPLVCNRCSAYFSSLPWVFIYFFHFQDWCSSFFFFRSLFHQLSSLCLCFFFHFLCSSIFILFITCFLFGIVFTWSLLWYIVSSILIICNCFIFRFHHISYIYIRIYIYIWNIVAPSQVFCFKEIRKLPQKDHQTCDAKSLYQFLHCKCNFAKKNWTIHAKNCMYAMHTVCVFLCLTLPRNNTAPCHKRGLMGRFI